MGLGPATVYYSGRVGFMLYISHAPGAAIDGECPSDWTVVRLWT